MLTAKLSRTTMYTKYCAQCVGYLSKNTSASTQKKYKYNYQVTRLLYEPLTTSGNNDKERKESSFASRTASLLFHLTQQPADV